MIVRGAVLRLNIDDRRFCTLSVGHAAAESESSVTVNMLNSGAYTVELRVPQIELTDNSESNYTTHTGAKSAAAAGTLHADWRTIVKSINREDGPSSFFNLMYERYAPGETTDGMKADFGVTANMGSLHVVYRAAFIEVGIARCSCRRKSHASSFFAGVH